MQLCASPWGDELFQPVVLCKRVQYRYMYTEITLLLTRPHCSRAVSTLLLSENILRILKHRRVWIDHTQRSKSFLSTETIHQPTSLHGIQARPKKPGFTRVTGTTKRAEARRRERKWKRDSREEKKEEVGSFKFCIGFKKRLGVGVTHFFTGIFPSWFTWSFNLVYLEETGCSTEAIQNLPNIKAETLTHTHTQSLTLWGGRCSAMHSGKVCSWPKWTARPSKSGKAHTGKNEGMKTGLFDSSAHAET